MTIIHVRSAGLADIDLVMEVMRSAFDPAFGEAWSAPQCEGVLSLPGADLLLATSAERPAGFALTRTILDEVELLLIAVGRDFQRCGVGRTLLKAVTEHAVEKGVNIVHLEVRSGNPAAELYKSVGFIQVGQRLHYYRGLDGQFFDAETYHLTMV
jgi:[ribosomal protein S18]-alanine N-acetyltransferase